MKSQQYWQEIREKVCSKCIDGDGQGNCRLEPSQDCAVISHLPLIINAVNRVTSDMVEDYVSELREIVCAQCKHQTVDGVCSLRTSVDCGLDRYFPLIIEAIENVNQRIPSQGA